jgi:hypothetical protein
MALFQSPTIEQLAEKINGEGWSAQFSSLVPIRPNGTRLPFFWVYGQKSDAILPRCLEPDQPIYGLIHQGHDGKEIHTTVEEIASHCLKEIRTVQPEGPYRLGGYCFGAIIALEIAQKLLERGEEVTLLFLVEPPRNCFPLTRVDNNHSFQSRVKSRVAYHCENLARLRLGESIAYTFQKLPSALSLIGFRVRGKINISICKAYLYLRQPIPVPLRRFYLPDIYWKAMARYIPKPYTGRVVLYFADLTTSRPSESNLTAGEVTIHRVDGSNHGNIVKEPYARIWASHLNLYLRELQVKKEDNKK